MHFKAHWITYGHSMIEGVSYDKTYMVFGLTLIYCEPEVVAYSPARPGTLAHLGARSPCRTIAAWPPSYEGYITHDGGPPAPFSAHKTKNMPQPVEAKTAANSKCARHATNIINPKKY